VVSVVVSIIGLVVVALCGYAVNSITHFLDKVNDFAEKYEEDF
jgi:hypothetical protein